MNQWDCIKQGVSHTFTPTYASIRGQIVAHAERFSDKKALIHTQEDVALSYRELVDALDQFGGYLTNAGLSHGDAFSFLMENTLEILIMEWSAWSYGYVTVPLDSKRDTLERKIYKLKLAQARILFVRRGLLSEEEKKALSQAIPSLTVIETQSFTEFMSLILRPHEQAPSEGELDSDCLLLYTSGTTALPKGVRLTPRSLWADADQIVQWLKITEGDRFHIILPLHHINSTTFSLATILAGGTVVLSPKYSKSEFWRLMTDHQITISSIVPTIALDLLSEQDAFAQHQDHLKQLTRIQIGSSPVQPVVVRQFYTQYGIRLVQGYGSTETSLRCLGVPTDVSDSEYLALVDSNATGMEMAHDNVTVLRDDGTEAMEGEDGEICVRGSIIMRGYKENDEATREAFHYGWFHTGDVGYYHIYQNQKLYFLKGRSKELIIKGGVNISPVAIEDAVLRAFPTVFFCYAVGFPDHRLGETIGIVVDGPEETLLQLRNTLSRAEVPGLSSFEQPSAMIQLSSDDLPKTSSGKVQRIDIARRYGPELQREMLTVAKTGEYLFRLMTLDDHVLFADMVEIYNSRWPKTLAVNELQIRNQVEYGIVIGMFDQSEKLVGFISGLVFYERALLGKEQWTQSWNGITAGGRCTTHTQKGDALMCVGITIRAEGKEQLQNEEFASVSCTEKEAEEYIRSGRDPIMRFHQTPKAGFAQGAEIVEILPYGRPDDSEACGYNVILKYPELDCEPTINEQASRGVQLLEAALLFAYKNKKKKVYVYSRPAGLAHYLRQEKTIL